LWFEKWVSLCRRRCSRRLMDWGYGRGRWPSRCAGPKGDALEVGGQWRDDGRGMASQEKIGKWTEQAVSDSKEEERSQAINDRRSRWRWRNDAARRGRRRTIKGERLQTSEWIWTANGERRGEGAERRAKKQEEMMIQRQATGQPSKLCGMVPYKAIGRIQILAFFKFNLMIFPEKVVSSFIFPRSSNCKFKNFAFWACWGPSQARDTDDAHAFDLLTRCRAI
jgi:hypothetical protein